MKSRLPNGLNHETAYKNFKSHVRVFVINAIYIQIYFYIIYYIYNILFIYIILFIYVVYIIFTQYCAGGKIEKNKHMFWDIYREFDCFNLRD